ncbi:PKD domain-containing protein [Pedobacter frigoris]|uniref:PKD domain-containing protein n=1 Tax=Pedobacter frigoris TaxID=2571272 RepID=A0A4U1CQ13_9SPHI|nr:PKD domain-containing protein [Pedobacter frigoris]TKC07595.1 PKD domain-containing protein [Pedobacter frigoris]
MLKILIVPLIVLCSLVSSIKVNAQLSFGTIDPGPYGRGSSIAVPINVPSNACYAASNVFELWISDASQNFSPGRKIGEISGTFSTYINGTLPGDLTTGNYKLRIITTSPLSSTDYPGTIPVVNATGPFVGTAPSNPAQVLSPQKTFGWCGSAVGDNKSIIFTDDTNPPVVQKLSIKDEKTGTVQEFSSANQMYPITGLAQSYYTVTVTGETTNAGITVKSTKSYLLLNVLSKVSIQSYGSPFGCIDPIAGTGADISYAIDITGANGIQNNYPGSRYSITWGDGQEDILTHCELANSNGIITHNYKKTSCGQPPIDLGNGTSILNAYRVSVTSVNPFCQNDLVSASIYPKVFSRPIAKIDPAATTICTNTPIVLSNLSTKGNNSDCSMAMNWEWYVDGVLMSTNETYTHPGFATPGTHSIKLVASNNVGICRPSEDYKTICIQEPPKPSFTLNGSSSGITLCNPVTLKPINTSIVNENCIPTTYRWIITGGSFTFENGTTAASFEPQIRFTAAGTYKIQLAASITSCGEFLTPEQTITINALPTANLSDNIIVCNLTAYDFNNTTSGPTKTTLTGTQDPAPAGTYTWTISGGAYNFIGGTNAGSKYPTIQFTEYKTYTISVSHQNDCGTATDVQNITFTASPVVDAGNYPAICHDDVVQLNATITGSVDSYEWVGGSGTFAPNRNTLNAVYTPSPAERTAGQVNLTLRALTSLGAPCNIIEGFTTINIKPKNTITSPSTKRICTGSTVAYTPVSTLAGSDFTWTVISSNLATGFAATGSGATINDQITNTSATADASVTYRIVPSFDGCAGDPFDLTVTIGPTPTVTPSLASTEICSGQPAGITVTSNLAGTKYLWTSTTSDSLISGNSNNATVSATITQISDLLVNTGTTSGTVTYIITPVSVYGCNGTPEGVTVVINPAPTVANAGADESICSTATYVLKGNVAVVGTGKWTLVSGPGPVTFADDTNPNTVVSGLQDGGDYVFKWTITTPANCASSANVKISNLLPLQNSISSTNTTVCSGQSILISGDLPTGGNGTYTFTWESSVDGTTWEIIPNESSRNLSYILTSTLSFRRTVKSGSCTLVSNTVSINSQPPLGNNVVSADQAICGGGISNPLIGTVPTGGDGVYTYQWQSSVDNGNTWTDITNASSKDFSPPTLNMTTLYRRLVSTAACAGNLQNRSNEVRITINPNAKALFTFTADNGCAPFAITAQNIKADSYPQNASYTWYADGTPIGTGIDFPGYQITSGNTSVVIKLVTTSGQGCSADEMSQTFSTRQDITLSFTQDKTVGCGPFTVNFVNTSTSLANTAFSWDFGNGQTSTQIMPDAVVFAYDATGKDKAYTVTLTATTSCGVATPYTATVLVKAPALSVFSPDKTEGCSPMLVNFSNTSPVASNTTYTFDFGDGSPVEVKTDRSGVTHTYTTTNVVRTYIVRMTTKGDCGEHTTEHTISVAPNNVVAELVVNSTEKRGCAPFTVNFFNNSSGANSFVYDFDDGNTTTTISAPEKVVHTFTKAGTYTVKLTASNDCSTASTTETIVVLAQPQTAFTADKTLGCSGLEVKFNNTTVGGISYTWDFGDGSALSTETNPAHTYSGTQEFYTVTLTAKNSLGCSSTTTLTNFIHIVPPPVAQFSVQPGVEISIPNYTFSFTDESTNNPDIWHWDFGDGTTSTQRNPKHSYYDVGTYKVTLTVTNQNNCSSTTFKSVSITGVPGFLYVPNSFIPGSEQTELREFKAKGMGIKSWRFSIFDKWGETLWETTSLNDGKPAAGWDGTFRGSPMPQGIYFWKIDVQFINGSEWKGMTYNSSAPKRTGAIHLIR